MRETIPNKLQDHRFHISSESMEIMKDFREMFNEIHTLYPELEAISFFGSRIRGQEKNNSDLDIVVFRDLRKRDDGDTFPSFGATFLKDIIHKYDENKGTSKASFILFDVSDIEESLKKIKNWRKTSKNSENFDHVLMDIVSPFLLAVGNIYETRKKILDALEKEPDGEERFQDLMRQLNSLERPDDGRKGQATLPEYKYPKTIAEGKKYFLRNKQL